MQKLPVIFKLCEGEVTAVFPTLPGTNDPWSMTCYAHIGQHSSASIEWVRTAKPATPAQYAPLLRELQSIYHEYELVVRRRLSWKDTDRRKAALQKG